MAHFGRDEIVDCLRHGIALDDVSGFATRVLGKPIRRSKPGGLPLTLTNQNDSSDDDPLPQTLVLVEISTDSTPTSELCRESVLKKSKDLHNLIDARRHEKPKLDLESAKEYFKRKLVPPTPKLSTSLLTHLIVENEKSGSKVRFSEFSKFEALESEPDSRAITVVFPFSTRGAGNTPKTLLVRVKDRAMAEEFIGLCCYLYTQADFKPQCASPALYSLYLADDHFEFDVELPPLDRHRPVGECGFTLLALVQSDDQAENTKYVIVVHQTNGSRFVFELDTLTQTLEWLMKESAKRSAQLELQNPKMTKLRRLAYQLETLDASGQPLRLTNTIASAGTLEFVLLRQNSSRGDFVPSVKNELYDPSVRTQLFVQTKQRPVDWLHVPLMSTNSSSPMSSPMGTNASSTLTPVSRLLGSGEVISEFQVERLHRLKSRWSARLVIRDDCLEVLPLASEGRRKFVPQTSQKATTLSWDLVAGVEYTDRHNDRRLVKIVWLPISPDVFALQYEQMKQPTLHSEFYDFYQETPQEVARHSSSQSGETSDSSCSKARGMTDRSLPNFNISGSDDSNFQQLMQAYDELNWKILLLETKDEDAWKIGTKINEMVEQKRSFVRRIYSNSSNGTRRPRAAAELTISSKDSPSFPDLKRMSLVSTSLSTPNFKTHRKRLSINPVPMFTRMLSKPE